MPWGSGCSPPPEPSAWAGWDARGWFYAQCCVRVRRAAERCMITVRYLPVTCVVCMNARHPSLLCLSLVRPTVIRVHHAGACGPCPLPLASRPSSLCGFKPQAAGLEV